MAGVDLALDVARDVADAVEIGDRRSAEFHHQASHGVKNLTFPDAPKGANKRPAQLAPPQKARIHTGGVARLQYWRRSLAGRANLRDLAMRYIERILQPGEKPGL